MLTMLTNVESIIRHTGQHILMPAFLHQSLNTAIKGDGSIVTETDQKCQDFLQEKLNLLDAGIGFLGEEMSEQQQHQCLLDGGKFWCVDPLDGTANFATPMPLFAISVALIEQGSPVLACIYDPIRDEMVSALYGEGLRVNGLPFVAKKNPQPLAQSIGFIDFKRLNPKTARMLVEKNIYRSQRNLGSCALEWAWLALGRAQFIIHGGQKLWDYAAGLLLAQESGCVIADFSGTAPFLQPRLSSAIIATTDAALYVEWLKILLVDEPCSVHTLPNREIR